MLLDAGGAFGDAVCAGDLAGGLVGPAHEFGGSVGGHALEHGVAGAGAYELGGELLGLLGEDFGASGGAQGLFGVVAGLGGFDVAGGFLQHL